MPSDTSASSAGVPGSPTTHVVVREAARLDLAAVGVRRPDREVIGRRLRRVAGRVGAATAERGRAVDPVGGRAPVVRDDERELGHGGAQGPRVGDRGPGLVDVGAHVRVGARQLLRRCEPDARAILRGPGEERRLGAVAARRPVGHAGSGPALALVDVGQRVGVAAELLVGLEEDAAAVLGRGAEEGVVRPVPAGRPGRQQRGRRPVEPLVEVVRPSVSPADERLGRPDHDPRPGLADVLQQGVVGPVAAGGPGRQQRGRAAGALVHVDAAVAVGADRAAPASGRRRGCRSPTTPSTARRASRCLRTGPVEINVVEPPARSYTSIALSVSAATSDSAVSMNTRVPSLDAPRNDASWGPLPPAGPATPVSWCR